MSQNLLLYKKEFMKKLLTLTFLILGPVLFMGAKKVTELKDLELFNKVVHIVEGQYYQEVNFNKIMIGAIRGVLKTLDPHSSFLDKSQFQKMQKDTKGEFGGIGIEVSQKGEDIYIISAIEDTPAFKAGISPKDIIIEINNESTKGMRLDEAVEKMQGKTGEYLKLGIKRSNEAKTLYFNIKRKVIKIKPVYATILEKGYLFIRLKQFQKDSSEYIAKELKKYNAKKDLKGIVLDLRANPGGLLDEAVNVSSLFLKSGTVVSTLARREEDSDIRFVNKSGYKDQQTPLVVLVNEASASASEIVAGALQDHERAIIMGTQTFGKGSVQSVIQIDESYGLKLTVAQYITPKKRRIQAVGIKPDIIVQSIDMAEINKNDVEGLKEKDLKNHIKSKLKEGPKRTLANNVLARDYQVLQALNYLKSFKYFEKISK
jgi:carboxyl-terminal processing protease